MEGYQEEFLQVSLQDKILRFGEFTLNSGRVSPYFFNAGLFNTGSQLAAISKAYAQTIVNAKLEFDILFGPAYKGIPLTVSTIQTLQLSHGISKSYAFNRKVAKDHGEGGNIVGESMKGKQVLIIDDVITSGKAIREAIALIQKEGGEVVGVVVALDRMERTTGGREEASALQQLRQDANVPCFAIITLDDIIEFTSKEMGQEQVQAMQKYRQKYGV